MNAEVSIGFNVPTFAGGSEKGGTPIHRDAANYNRLDWKTTKRAIEIAEELGFDDLWVPDHMMLGVDDAEYEAWSVLSAAAGFTSNIGLGSLVLSNDYRNPALLAKMAATLDVISDGRLLLGLGAGWHREEYEAFGWEWRAGYERLMRLDESIRLLKAMWTEEMPTFEGEHYRIDGARCRPPPVQDPHPPILVGGAGEQVTLKLVAKHADIWNTGISNGHLDTLRRKIRIIEQYCDEIGRPTSDVEFSWDGHVICTRDSDRLSELLNLALPIEFEAGHPDQPTITTELEAREYMIVGSPEECVDAISERIDIGISRFQFWFLDFPSFDGMELFADEVLPELR